MGVFFSALIQSEVGRAQFIRSSRVIKVMDYFFTKKRIRNTFAELQFQKHVEKKLQ